MKPATGATPLIALDAVALDTETTGLDTAKARIVQIGALAVSRGRILDGRQIEMLVDPEIAIPSASTRIHGITNAMVRNAPAFASAWTAVQAFVENRVIIGHAIGFDLSMLEREATRAGLSWKKPRSLCVRLLARLVEPGQTDLSLDAIAARLGIVIEDRHSALGDARAAAEIFVTLLPKLQERGIRTLAEAERACMEQRAELETGHRAGWVDPISRPAPPSFRSVDPFAYRHRVGELMSSPPVVVAPSISVKDAVALMIARRISSLFVADPAEPGQPLDAYGIVTERDVMRLLASDGEKALAMPVDGIVTRPLASIREQAFAYRAVGRMDRLRIRHLAVRHEDGRLAGVVSARDLLKLRASAAINLDDTIEHAASPAEMAAAWAMLPGVADALIAERIDARAIAEIVSEELCALTRRAAILAEAEMAGEGHGPSPCPFAVLVLGSGGRGESLLAADQDNAVVFAEGDPDGPADRWFARLGEKIADLLDQSGVPYCKGGVMAKNALWRGSLGHWKERVADWIGRSRPQDLLNVDIFFDLRPVYGDLALGEALFAHAYELGHARPEFAKLLGEQVAPGNPFTLFGGLQLEGGRIDLKLHGLFPVVAMARTLAIRHSIRARSTRERLEGLIGLDIGGDQDMTAMLSAHSVLLALLLAQQSRDLYAGLPVSNRVELAKLDKTQRTELKAALKALQPAPDLVRDLMFG
jgi:DNA polymerase-3 subunit epsilon/CBS domain-containing protein